MLKSLPTLAKSCRIDLQNLPCTLLLTVTRAQQLDEQLHADRASFEEADRVFLNVHTAPSPYLKVSGMWAPCSV